MTKTDWARYGNCRIPPFGCGADAGKPCRDRRIRYPAPGWAKQKPCKDRPAAGRLIRFGTEE